MFFRSLPLLLISCTVAHAELRVWRSADGSRTFRGEFLKQADEVITIRNEAGKEITFPANKLHADDLKWVAEQEARKAGQAGVFGGIRFGVTRVELLEVLKANPHVSLPNRGKKTDAGFGESDPLVDVKTKAKPGGQPALVDFLWGGDPKGGTLISFDITCQPPEGRQGYERQLKKAHDELAELLVSIHGKPAATAPYPASEALKESDLVSTHTWNLADGSTIEMGVGLIHDGNFVAAARFSPPLKAAPPVENPP